MVWKIRRKRVKPVSKSQIEASRQESDDITPVPGPSSSTLSSGSAAFEWNRSRQDKDNEDDGKDKAVLDLKICEVVWEGQPQKPSLRCETAPWTHDNARDGRISIQIAPFIEQRLEDTSYFDLYPEYTRRMRLWGVAQLACDQAVPEEVLLRSSGTGRSFTLTPHPRSSVPMQWTHVGPGAIPDDLADMPCSDMQAIGFLDQLNSVCGTSYSLDVPGLRDCLEYALRKSRDFGVAYGTLRPWWSHDFAKVVDLLEQQRARLEGARSKTIRGLCIVDSNLPARRIWDLYSNRILPFHVLPQVVDPTAEVMAPNVWAVSHSWVDEKDRHDIWTRINGEEWPVPLPRATSLSHIRVELLNIGAQYVWLDVLCLRQKGGKLAEAEAQRAAEWRLDVPTIGKSYQRWKATCVIYFNGLGLPLDTRPATLSSPRHWCNRAWTLQEGCLGWLPAGVDPSRPISRAFFRELEAYIQPAGYLCDLKSAVHMRDRHCTTELDRIAGLAYIFQSQTLPVYSERMPVAHAWLLLLKSLQADLRTQIFFQYAPATPFEIWVPWERFLEGRPELPFWASKWVLDDRPEHDMEPLQLFDPEELYSDNPSPRYCHEGRAAGHCHITTAIRQTPRGAKDNIQLTVHKCGKSFPIVFAAMTGILLPEVEYTLIAFALGHWKGYPPWWVAVEVVAAETDSRAKGGTQGMTTVEGIRWAVLYMDQVQKIPLLDFTPYDIRVVYFAGEEALQKTRYKEQYLAAIAETLLIS